MLKWTTPILMVLVMVQIVCAPTIIQISTDNETWWDFAVFEGTINETDKKAFVDELDNSKIYYFRGKNDSTDWYYVSQRTQGDDSMASMAVTSFILLLTGAFFYLGMRQKPILATNPLWDLVMRRASIAMGVLLLNFDATIILTMADNLGLGITQEMFRYLFFLHWAAYLALFFMFWTTLIQSLKMYGAIKQQRRMGMDG